MSLILESPTGGEIWQAGTSYRIRWRGGFPSLPVDIFLQDGKCLKSLATNFKNSGIFFWVAEGSGQYKIVLRNAIKEGGASYQPVSSKPFTIVNSSPPAYPAYVPDISIPTELVSAAPVPVQKNDESKQMCAWCEVAQPTLSCVSCETHYCQDCDAIVHGKKAMQAHKRVSVLSEAFSRFCSEVSHQTEKLSLFCNVCDIAVCSLCCLVGSHKGHNYEPIESARQKLSILNETALLKATEQRANLLEKLAVIDKEISRRTEMKEANDAHTYFGLYRTLTTQATATAAPIRPSMTPTVSAAAVSPSRSSIITIAPAARVIREMAPATSPLKFEGSFDTNGILYFLGTNYRKECYEHPAKRGLVRCSRSSENVGTADGMFGWIQSQNFTQNVASSWAMITFLAHEIAPLHYSILNSRGNIHTLRNWKLQALDQRTGHWIDLVSHVHDTTLQHPTQPFVARAIVDPTHRFYSTFRILQTGVDACNTHHLMMGGFEIYGYLAPRH